MIYIVLGTAYGLFLFFIGIKAYTVGLKHGKLLIDKEVPTIINPIAEPIQKVIQHFEEKKQEQEIKSVVEDYWR